MRRFTLATLATVGLLAVLTACSSATSNTPQTPSTNTAKANSANTPQSALMQKMKKTGEITIGTSNDPPWSYVTQSGKTLGIVPDILREYLKDNNLKVKIKTIPMPFNSLIPSIQSGRIDMIADAMYATPERAKSVAFTDVLFYNPEALVVKNGNPLGIKTLKDLCGHSGGTYQGTVWVQSLQDANKSCPASSQIDIKTYATIDNVISDIAAGRLNGGLIDSSIAAYAIKKNPNVGIALSKQYRPPDKAADNNALAVSLANKPFVQGFNAWFHESSTATFMKQLFDKWGLTPSAYWLTLKG